MANELRYRATIKDDVSGPLERLRAKFDAVRAQGVKGFGIGVGAALTTTALGVLNTALAGVGEAIQTTIQDASDLNESVSKSGVVFGESAARISKWAETSATAMGISKQAALEQAGTLGNLLLSMGNTQQAAADMSMAMVQLAADIGSFNNVDTEEVLTAMRSGLTGEIAPLRRFGVNLTDVTLKAKAMELGLYDGTGALNVQAKSAAAYQLILEQTTTAQGDFARTSNGLANTQRILAAEMKDLSAKIGEELLPIMLDLARWVHTTVIPALSSMVDWVKENEWAIQTLGDALKFATQGPLALAVDKTEEFREAQEKAAGGVLDTGKAVNTMALGVTRDIRAAERSVTKFGDEATATRKKFWRAMDDIVEKMRKTNADLESIVSDAIDAIYDPLRRQMDLTATQAEISAQQRILADKQSTAEEIAGARARITELQIEAEQIKTTQVVLGEAIDEGSALMKKYVADWAKAGPDARKQISALIDELNRLRRASESPIYANFSFTGQSGSTQQHRAGGGPVLAGQSYLVGENGPEILRMSGSQNGSINPSAAGAMGGGVSIAVNVSAPMLTPGMAQSVVNEIGPALADYLRRRNLVAA